jgi:hypothetical protein
MPQTAAPLSKPVIAVICCFAGTGAFLFKKHICEQKVLVLNDFASFIILPLAQTL